MKKTITVFLACLMMSAVFAMTAMAVENSRSAYRDPAWWSAASRSAYEQTKLCDNWYRWTKESDNWYVMNTKTGEHVTGKVVCEYTIQDRDPHIYLLGEDGKMITEDGTYNGIRVTFFKENGQICEGGYELMAKRKGDVIYVPE